jgi:hypothetical protein
LPNRILRDGILESRGVNSLSDDGQLLYYRLLSIVDDFGRYEAAEDILRAKCFPLLLDRWPLTRVNAALTDVCQINALTGRTLIVIYQANEKKYLQINNFNQRMRAAKSKWPSPDGHESVVCQTDDRPPHASRARTPPPPNTSPPPNTPPTPTEEISDIANLAIAVRDTEPRPATAVQDDLGRFETWFEQQYARHPKKGNRILAEQAAASAYQDREFTLEAFEKCHAAWCASEEWRWKGGAKAPHLGNWIHDKGFRYLPEGAIEQRTKEYDSEKDMREHMEDEKRRAARAAARVPVA